MNYTKPNETLWYEGFPYERGIYKCRVDGKEQYLVHHKCNCNRKNPSWWSTINGQKVEGKIIEWTGEKIKIEEKK